MDKNYAFIHCREEGFEYKKLVRSYGEFEYLGLTLFIHKAVTARDTYVISDRISGIAVCSGLTTPTAQAAKSFLTRKLTAQQNRILIHLSHQEMYHTSLHNVMIHLPYRSGVAQEIEISMKKHKESLAEKFTIMEHPRPDDSDSDLPF